MDAESAESEAAQVVVDFRNARMDQLSRPLSQRDLSALDVYFVDAEHYASESDRWLRNGLDYSWQLANTTTYFAPVYDFSVVVDSSVVDGDVATVQVTEYMEVDMNNVPDLPYKFRRRLEVTLRRGESGWLIDTVRE